MGPLGVDRVTLDLGGRTISLDPSTLYGIRIDLSGVPAPHLGVVVVNGRIKGGGIGIYVPSLIPSLKLEGLEVVGTSSDGIHVQLAEPAKGFTGDMPAIVLSNSLIHGIGGDGVMLADPRPSPLCSLTIGLSDVPTVRYPSRSRISARVAGVSERTSVSCVARCPAENRPVNIDAWEGRVHGALALASSKRSDSRARRSSRGVSGRGLP